MAKAKKTIFFCQQCGYETAKWMGQCPGCREWNTFVEEPAEEKHAGISTGNRRNTQSVEPMPLSRVEMTDQERFTTGIGELDRVLGGGIVPASLVLVGGDPGIGKSTLLLQVCKNLADAHHSVLYISGEESLQQIKIRADRIGSFTESLELFCETNLADISSVLRRKKPRVVIIDSIQTMYSEEVSSAAGKRFPGASGDISAASAGKISRYYDFYRRTCDKRRCGGRPACAGTYGGHGIVF